MVLLGLRLTGSALATDAELRTAVGIVQETNVDNGTLVFELQHVHQRFLIPEDVAATDVEVAGAALQSSLATNKGVSVHYFLSGATFRLGEANPTYVVRDITYDGRTIQLEGKPPAVDPNSVPLPRDVAADNLARGIALADDADTREALRALTFALNSDALEPDLRILALKTRGRLYDESAGEVGPGEGRDRLFLAALNDASRWHALAPQDEHPLGAAANLQNELGAYEEAIRLNRRLIRQTHDPNMAFWGYISIAGIYRTMGDYDASLATLDKLVKVQGPQDGMPFHYHRGWTLRLAGRIPEAISEFTAGLKSQPDYGGAFFQLACAYAQTGQLAQAIADQEQYVQSLAVWGNDTPPSPRAQKDIDHASDVLAALKSAYTADPHGKTDAPCVGYLNIVEARRERSTLLPPDDTHGRLR